MIYKDMNKKWLLIIIHFVIIIISDHIYLNYINKGFLLNFAFVIGTLIILWTIYYLIYKTVKKLKI